MNKFVKFSLRVIVCIVTAILLFFLVKPIVEMYKAEAEWENHLIAHEEALILDKIEAVARMDSTTFELFTKDLVSATLTLSFNKTLDATSIDRDAEYRIRNCCLMYFANFIYVDIDEEHLLENLQKEISQNVSNRFIVKSCEVKFNIPEQFKKTKK